MAVFVVGEPVRTDQPFVVVDAGLRPGRYRFALEVFDSAGNRSRPAELIVSVVAPAPPPTPQPR